jgi:hypothetical protein
VPTTDVQQLLQQAAAGEGGELASAQPHHTSGEGSEAGSGTASPARGAREAPASVMDSLRAAAAAMASFMGGPQQQQQQQQHQEEQGELPAFAPGAASELGGAPLEVDVEAAAFRWGAAARCAGRGAGRRCAQVAGRCCCIRRRRLHHHSPPPLTTATTTAMCAGRRWTRASLAPASPESCERS